MPHFVDEYADQLNRMLHTALSPTWCYKQEIVIVPGLITAIFVTYDGVRDDSREIREASWDDFVKRITAVDPDWDVTPEFMQEVERTKPAFGMGGWAHSPTDRSLTVHVSLFGVPARKRLA